MGPGTNPTIATSNPTITGTAGGKISFQLGLKKANNFHSEESISELGGGILVVPNKDFQSKGVQNFPPGKVQVSGKQPVFPSSTRKEAGF